MAWSFGLHRDHLLLCWESPGQDSGNPGRGFFLVARVAQFDGLSCLRSVRVGLMPDHGVAWSNQCVDSLHHGRRIASNIGRVPSKPPLKESPPVGPTFSPLIIIDIISVSAL